MSTKLLVSKRQSLMVQALFVKGDGNVECVSWVTKVVSRLPWESPGACILAPNKHMCIQCSCWEICVALGMLHFSEFVYTHYVSFSLPTPWWWYCRSSFMGEEIKTPGKINDFITDTLMVRVKHRTSGLWNNANSTVSKSVLTNLRSSLTSPLFNCTWHQSVVEIEQ